MSISVPRSTLDAARRFFHPSYGTPLLISVAAIVLLYAWSRMIPNLLLRSLQAILLIVALLFAWFGVHRKVPRRGMSYALAIALFVSTFQPLWRVQGWDLSYVPFLLAIAIAVVYGMREGLILVGVLTVLELVAQGSAADPDRTFLVNLGFRYGALLISVVLFGYVTRGQRRRIDGLREDLRIARSSPYSAGERDETGLPDEPDVSSTGSESGIESLEKSIDAILVRVKESFRAHTVALFQPCGDPELVLRQVSSDSSNIQRGLTINTNESLLGQVSVRGVSCKWNLTEAGLLVTAKEIPYYTCWEPVRHIAASPLRVSGRSAGILVADRTNDCPFTEVDMLHLEIFAIQLQEMIQIGKRYQEQVDRNVEYRLFYQSMSELGQSLAPEDVLESLAIACGKIVESSHTIVALVDEPGLSYRIGYAAGAESLKGTTVRGQARTWISWMMSAGSEPLLLTDIRSHATKMAIASPDEEAMPVRSVLMVPLVFKERKLAILFLASPKVDFYRNWHLRVILAICQQAAANIENSLLHRRVESEAVTDGLTQLENHRYFQERFKIECGRAKRSGNPISLLIVDIDHFKKVNDTYGHRAGDMILQQIAAILKTAVRSEDSIARYGGEEFVVILTASDRKGAAKMGERLRNVVERTPFVADEHAMRLSITCGTATFPQDGSEPFELIEHADQALYFGKNHGRNCVVQYHSLEKTEPPIQNVR